MIVQNLKKHFPIRRGLLRRTVGYVRAIDDVSFTILGGRNTGVGRRKWMWQNNNRSLHHSADRADRG